MKHGKKSKKMMAGGRAGVKKMNIGGMAKTVARNAYKAKTAPLQVASMVANKLVPKSKVAKGLKKAATPFRGGGRAGMKKMRGGGVAAAGTTTGPATITAVNQPTTPIPPRAPNLGPRPKGGAGIDSPLGGRGMSGGVRRFTKGGKVISNKEMEIFKATSPRISKERTKQMIGKAGKTISNKDKKIVAKKMGGRAGVVKMMNGGDPLSKRGVKMGMSMSPSKNKGKGLYGK